MSARPKVAVLPYSDEGLVSAVEAGGGERAEPDEADALIWTNFMPEGLPEVLSSSPAKWVQLPFAGIERFFEAGVIDDGRTWTCAKGIYGRACAEHALALMLAAARRLRTHLRAAAWVSPHFGSGERMLQGDSALVVGAGGIGRALIPMLLPLDVRVLALNRRGTPVEGAERTVASADLLEVLPEVDWVVLTAALTPETKGMVDRKAFERMRSDAWVLNVARGGLIVTDDLVDALRAGDIGGAALDVTDPEPLPEDHPLWEIDNAVITPHVANTLDMGLPELRALVQRNVANFAAGRELEGPVDPAAGY